jgi:hypothetical protein
MAQLSQGEKTFLLYTSMLLVLVVIALMVTCSAHAQEVNMNQPSADVVDKGHLFVRSDSFYTQSDIPGSEHLWGNINFAYGLGHNLEVSVNGSDIYHGADTWQIVPGFKYAPIKKGNFELYVGDQYYKPVSNFTGFHNGNVTYEAIAEKFDKGNLRLTAGSYQSTNAYRLGNSAGAILGVEYMAKMFKNGWMLGPGADWASGSGANGYFSPGLMFSKGSFFVCPGYMIGNPHATMGAHQTFVMIGKTF